MKKIITLLAVAFITVSAIASEFLDVTVSEVKVLAESKQAVIIDVNGTESYKKGHVPGALDYATIKDNLAASLPSDKSALIIAYCSNPKCGMYLRAARAAAKLGYTNIKHMPAGIDGWNSAGLKTE